MKIIDYMIAEATNFESLESIVKRLIKEGWQPFGGVSYELLKYERQAMVKYEEVE